MSRKNLAVENTDLDCVTPNASVTEPPDQSLAQFLFWINCIGAPLVAVQNGSDIVRHVNDCAEAFFRAEKANLEHRSLEHLVGRACADLLSQIWAIPKVGGLSKPFLLKGHISGEDRHLVAYITPLRVDGADYRLYTFRDTPPDNSIAISSWQRSVLELLNWLPFGFEVSNTNDEVQFVNSHFERMFGYEPHELEDIEQWWLKAYPDPAYRAYARDKWYDEIATARAEGREMTPFDLEVATKWGDTRIIQFRHRAIADFHVNLYLDVTTERRAAQNLMRLAETDPLTGALNRRSFFEQATRLLTGHGAAATPHAVLMLDVDHFKTLNDKHGHAAGDRALEEITRRCRSVLRNNDVFARMGGEEFAVLLADAEEVSATEIAERLRACIATTPFSLDGAELGLTVSIGVALVGREDLGVEPALKRADMALYAAKHAGRDRIVTNTGRV